jgi:hypothetical protein
LGARVGCNVSKCLVEEPKDSGLHLGVVAIVACYLSIPAR